MSFLIAISRTGIPKHPAVDNIFTLNNAGITFTMFADGSVHREQVGGVDDFTFAGSADGLWLFTIRYRKKGSCLEIEKSTVAGMPVYYCLDGKGAFFCSTSIALLRSTGVSIEENRRVLPEYFCYRCVMPPNTLYRGISQLPFGGRIRVSIYSGRCSVDEVSSFHAPLPYLDDSTAAAANGIRDRIEAAVTTAGVGTEETAVLLSGGIDSSVLWQICRKTTGLNASYSTSFPFEDPALDVERRYAISAGEGFGSKHAHYVPETVQYVRSIVTSIALA